MSNYEQLSRPPYLPGHQFQHVQVTDGARAHLGDTYNISRESPLSLLPFATNAPFNSYGRQHEPTCLPNTRVDILQKISQWADGEDQQCLFWLSGMAGTGKSTIAHTIARGYFEQDRLAASFFFSRGGGDVGNAGKFVTTIAVQLAVQVPPVQRYICDAITERSTIASQSLADQWRQLVVRPLLKLEGKDTYPSYVVIIDALDECEGENDIRIILRLLAEARSLKKVRLRVLIISRPEVPIRYGFCQIPNTEHGDFILHDIEAAIVDHDISIFLEYELRSIGQERSLGAGWPGELVIRLLVRKASGLFIWAATACRFIREGRRFVPRRLNMMLQGDKSVAAQENHLNEIYLTVLENSIHQYYTKQEKEDLYNTLREILGSIVILSSPLSADALATLLHIPKQDVDQALEELHAILDIPEDRSRPLRLHHPSFRDFLLDKERCGNSNFQVDEKQAHQTLANSCIQLMSTSLKQGICGIEAPGVLVTDIKSSQVKKCLAPEVQYACLYWVQHLQRSGAQLYDQVYQFLQNHVLHWFEALSWMGKTSEGLLAIFSLETIVLSSDCPDLYAFIHDMKRFALYNRSAIEQAPLQTYYSALIFAPVMSIVRRQFKNRVSGWMQRLPDVQKDWSALLQTLEGHSRSVNAVAFSPDGRQLISASDDETVRLWDAATGAALQTLEGHSDVVNAVAFSPNSKQIASVSNDETVRLWDAATGAALQTLEGHSDAVNAVVFSPDGRQLASASYDETVRLWDTATGAALQTLEGHSSPINAVAFSPNGKLIASVSDDETVRLWDTATGAVLQTLEGHSGPVNAVVFSPDGRQLVSASGDETVRLWDTATGAALQTLEGHSDIVNAVVFSPNGKQIASVSNDKTVRLWHTVTGAALQTLEGHSSIVNAVAFSPNGKQIASASYDATVRLWDVATGAQTLEGHTGLIRDVAFSPDGRQLASASSDETVRLWDTAAGAQTFEGYSGFIRHVALSPDGRQLASVSGNKTVRLWNAVTRTALQTLKGHSGYVMAVTFSPDGKQLVSASSDEIVRLWNAATGAALQTFKGYSGLCAVTFSPDGKQLTSVSKKKTVRLWNATTGTMLQTFKGHSNHVKAMTFSPNGKQLASASCDKTVKLWDTITGTTLQTFESHSNFVNAVTFSPNGKQIASASCDKTVKLWHTVTGAALRTLEGHSDVVNAVAFSPNGKQIASASDDETIRLWNTATGAALQVLKVDVVVKALSFSVDGSCLETDRGLLNVATSLLFPGAVLSRPALSRDIFVKKQWVARGKENLLWLPCDYRSKVMTVCGSVVVLRHVSGRISFLEFALS